MKRGGGDQQAGRSTLGTYLGRGSCPGGREAQGRYECGTRRVSFPKTIPEGGKDLALIKQQLSVSKQHAQVSSILPVDDNLIQILTYQFSGKSLRFRPGSAATAVSYNPSPAIRISLSAPLICPHLRRHLPTCSCGHAHTDTSNIADSIRAQLEASFGNSSARNTASAKMET